MSEAIRRLRHPLDPRDAEAIAALLRSSFDTPEQAWDAVAVSDLARDGALVVAAPSGCAVIRVALDEVELLSIAVTPESRQRGLGARLLAVAEAEARAAGAARMFLEVAESNAAARALYARAGYSLAGRRRGYYRHDDGRREDALVLARDFGPGVTPTAPRA